MPLTLTAPMKQRLTRRTLEMVQRALGYFPELEGAAITIGYTRKHLGSATVIYRRGELHKMIVRLRVRKVTYHTIGHELTHLVQGLSYGERYGTRAVNPERIPSGETQCDIWTLARDPLFLDDPPTYIKMPRALREHWPDYAEAVRELCIAAIARRHMQRNYIQWLEKEIKNLPKARIAPVVNRSAQLELPFVV